MILLLLILAILCWAVAGVPGLLQVPALAGKVDFGWLGMALFGLWLLLGGPQAQAVIARLRG